MPSVTAAVLDAMESDDAAAALLVDAPPADAAPGDAPSSNAPSADAFLKNLIPEGEPVDKGKDVAEL
jgi:hypothetical protein